MGATPPAVNGMAVICGKADWYENAPLPDGVVPGMTLTSAA